MEGKRLKIDGGTKARFADMKVGIRGGNCAGMSISCYVIYHLGTICQGKSGFHLGILKRQHPSQRAETVARLKSTLKVCHPHLS
jgi:hypothetical protein